MADFFYAFVHLVFNSDPATLRQTLCMFSANNLGCALAGQPQKRAALIKIERLGGIDWFIEKIAGGGTVRSISRDHDISEHVIYKWLHLDPDRSAMVKAARKIAAERLADEALELADGVEAETTAISKVREQISVRKWRAAAFDPDTWATNKNQVAVQVNVGAQHLDARPLPEHREL